MDAEFGEDSGLPLGLLFAPASSKPTANPRALLTTARLGRHTSDESAQTYANRTGSRYYPGQTRPKSFRLAYRSTSVRPGASTKASDEVTENAETAGKTSAFLAVSVIPTERGGFEPPVEFDPHAALAKRCYRPLSHLSGPFGRITFIAGKATKASQIGQPRVCRSRGPDERTTFIGPIFANRTEYLMRANEKRLPFSKSFQRRIIWTDPDPRFRGVPSDGKDAGE